MIKREYSFKVDTGSATFDAAIAAAFISFVLSLPLAWVSHVIWIIRALASDKGATVGQMVLGAIGAFMPPVGIVHGYLLWFGWGS